MCCVHKWVWDAKCFGPDEFNKKTGCSTCWHAPKSWGPNGCSGQTRFVNTCTGKTTEQAGLRHCCQPAAVSSLVAIRGTWQRNRLKLIHIYDGLVNISIYSNKLAERSVCQWQGHSSSWLGLQCHEIKGRSVKAKKRGHISQQCWTHEP